MSAVVGSGSYLYKAISALTPPYTLVAWGKGSAAGSIFGIGSTSAASGSALQPWSDNALYFTDRGGGSEAFATGPSFTPTVWNLFVALVNTTSSRIARVNSTSGSAQTSTITTTGIDRLTIGMRMFSNTPTEFWTGKIAHIAAYNALLGSTDLTSLLTLAPNLVNAAALQHYESLISGAGALTNSGATFDGADNPSITLTAGSTFRRRFVCVGA